MSFAVEPRSAITTITTTNMALVTTTTHCRMSMSTDTLLSAPCRNMPAQYVKKITSIFHRPGTERRVNEVMG